VEGIGSKSHGPLRIAGAGFRRKAAYQLTGNRKETKKGGTVKGFSNSYLFYRGELHVRKMKWRVDEENGPTGKIRVPRGRITDPNKEDKGQALCGRAIEVRRKGSDGA